MSKIRSLIASKYHIDCIIKLDKRTFGSALINSYALILRNISSKKSTQYIDYTDSSLWNIHRKSISKADLVEGFWISRKQSRDNCCWDVKRGNISSSDFIKQGQPVLHTSKSCDNWTPSLRYVSKKIKPTVFVEDGDIIVSRIGRSAGFWSIHRGKKLPITDCLFRIKDIDGSIRKRINGKKYTGRSRGMTTQYITYNDFCDWIDSN